MNEAALKERLKIIAKNRGMTINDCWKQLLLERFLVRVAKSKHKNKLIFKGGFLLSYILETDRETVDLDFLLTRLKARSDDIRSVMETISNVDADDEFRFGWVGMEELAQPHMEYSGFRIRLSVTFGKMRDIVQIDLGIGDEVQPKERHLKLFSYKGKPLFEDEISLLVYPLEAVFAEKLHALVSHGKANSRMKDYHDMLIMVRDQAIEKKRLNKAIQTTFKQREKKFKPPITFSDADLQQLQKTWNLYRAKQRSAKLPASMVEILAMINGLLKKISFDQ